MKPIPNSEAKKVGTRRIYFRIDNFIELLKSYLSSTHLHGCRYIVDKKYNILAPLYWITLLSLSFTFCVYLIFLQMNRYQDSPVLNVITSTGYPVWKSPFPTVAICNHNVVYKNNSGNVTKILKDNGVQYGDIEYFLNNLSQLIFCDDCLQDTHAFDVNKLSYMYGILERFGYDVSKLMKELAHPCKNMLKKCKWQASTISCVDTFKLIKTGLGFCCAFNYYGTVDEQTSKEEPFYTGGAGLGSGLTVTINIDPTQYISTVNTIPGVTIFTHSGYRYPQMGVLYNSITIGQVISVELEQNVFQSDTDIIRLTPESRVISVELEQNVFQSDTDIIRLTPESRGCLFEHESHSNWTGIYNSQTCFNECKANYILRICDCIPFYYPTINNSRGCTFSDLSCLHTNRKKFVNLMLSDNIEADTEYMHQHGDLFPEFCYCLPNCNEVTYLRHDEKKKAPLTNETCVVNVYYSNVAGILRIRTAIFTWDTLLGTIGGTFGLCMGGSVISLLKGRRNEAVTLTRGK
ncbi:Amiloride-sensitive sodium channel [Popillia japonica]|uniref:Amiloride-sensitive sodium channel n=1 Tax=Popillia japonica TaxID=7064 RepID=A0AAW1JD76_POPJA